MQVSVKENRNLYIGGSDIPIIMGISPFKKRFDLLLEKAELQENTFEGNEFTEYGNVMEPKIRKWINANLVKVPFVEDKLIDGDVRCHYDGINDDSILEIKTTNQIHDNVDDYLVYLVQLLFYMHYSKKNKGILAVYERPSDFNEEFDEFRLTIYDIKIENYESLVQEILTAVERFREDLTKLKENPMLSEEDLMPLDIQKLSEKLIKLEDKLNTYNNLINEYDSIKEKLFNAMEKNNVKKWEMNNGTLITRVASSTDKVTTIKVFNEDKFKEENKKLYNQYVETKEKVTKGKKGYLKITYSKNDVEK